MQEIRESEYTVIYGAGAWGRWMAERLLEKGVPRSKLLFAVSRKDTEEEVMGIPVKEIAGLAETGHGLFVIIAVKGETRIEMLGNLQRLGIDNVILADDGLRQMMRTEM